MKTDNDKQDSATEANMVNKDIENDNLENDNLKNGNIENDNLRTAIDITGICNDSATIKKITDTEITISKALRVGVFLSAIITAAGLIFFLITNNSGYPAGEFPITASGIFKGVIQLKPYAIMMFGLLILILTPIFRVGMSVITFAREKDKLYVIITSAVFVILMISLLLSKGE